MREGQAIGKIRGASPAARWLREEIEAVAAVGSTVLLSGETGVGKGLVARAIHERSPRCFGPFVHVDCAALSPALIESEIFGHERGAFTGAGGRRSGRFELAAQGTLLLDEIGDLAPELQAKLLRVLEDREFERVGGTHTLSMQARILAASNRDLPWAVREGRFREDLFYRLKVVQLRVPPLRERRGDVALLAQEQLERIAGRLGTRPPFLEEKLVARLEAYAWPGNFREFANLLEGLAVRHPGRRLGAAALDGWLDAPAPAPAERSFVPARVRPERERDRVVRALAACGGNVSRAAASLGVPRSTLRYWMRRCGIPSPAAISARDPSR